jgi:hypothetical protein
MAVASLLPDSDNVLRVFGADVFLFGHEGATHSLAALALQVVLLVFVFRNYAPGVPAGWLAGFSAAGLGLHAAMDSLTAWGPALLAPVSARHFSLDWVADTDAVFILVSAIAFAAGLAREPLREAYNRTAFGLLISYSAVCAGSHAMGVEQARSAMAKIGIRPDRIEAFPRFLSPFRWNGVAWTADRYYQAEVGAFSGVQGRLRSYFRLQLPPELKCGFADRYMEWARVPLVRLAAGRFSIEAVLGDLRYVTPGGPSDYAAVISASKAGPLVRWLGRDESMPGADMEFELPTK